MEIPIHEDMIEDAGGCKTCQASARVVVGVARRVAADFAVQTAVTVRETADNFRQSRRLIVVANADHSEERGQTKNCSKHLDTSSLK